MTKYKEESYRDRFHLEKIDFFVCPSYKQQKYFTMEKVVVKSPPCWFIMAIITTEQSLFWRQTKAKEVVMNSFDL